MEELTANAVYKAELGKAFAKRGYDARLNNLTRKWARGCFGDVIKNDGNGFRRVYVFTTGATAKLENKYGAEILVKDGAEGPLPAWNDERGGRFAWRYFDTIEGLVDYVCGLLG